MSSRLPRGRNRAWRALTWLGIELAVRENPTTDTAAAGALPYGQRQLAIIPLMMGPFAKRVSRLRTRLSRDLTRWQIRALDADHYVHFFHIGRNAGTTIKAFIEHTNLQSQTSSIIAHEHKIGLCDVPANARYFFSIRDPIGRFYSAFYWRKNRRKQPGNLSRPDGYSEQERRAFSRFTDANDLAEGLFAQDAVGLNAFAAMQQIKHVDQPQHSWFSNLDEVLTVRPPLCIIRLDKMGEDLKFLAAKLSVVPPETVEKHHQNSYSDTPPLSPRAIENLRRWYAADLHFFELANSWAELHQGK